MTKTKQIGWCCSECGLEANRLTCLKKFGAEPLVKSNSVSTFHPGICEVCGKKRAVTEPRDFFYPDFSLLKGKEIKSAQRELKKQLMLDRAAKLKRIRKRK